MSSEDLAAKRVRLLLQQIEAERGWGWQTSLAKDLQVAQSYISKLYKEERGPGIDIITAAKQRLGVDPNFFVDDTVVAPHYRDFIGRGSARVEREDVVAVRDFLEQMGGRVTPEHAHVLRSMEWKTPPTVATITELWAVLRAADGGRALPSRVIPPPPVPAGAKRLPKKARK